MIRKIVFTFSSWFRVQGFSKLWSFACWLSPCCPQSESLWSSVLSAKIYCIYFSSIHLELQMYELVQRREQLIVSQEPKSLSFIPLVSASLTKWSKERKKEKKARFTSDLHNGTWTCSKILGWSIVSRITMFRKFYESLRFLEIILGLSGQSLCIFKYTFSSFKFKFKVIQVVIDQATEPHRYNLVNLYFIIKLKKKSSEEMPFFLFMHYR